MLIPAVKAKEFEKFGFKKCRGEYGKNGCYYLCVAKLIEVNESLRKRCKEVEDLNKEQQRKINDKKTSCKINKGNDFCFCCENSYRYNTYWGVEKIERCGCLLDIECEDFKRKNNC